MLLLFISLVAAELIELGNLKLHENYLMKKTRYIFSDFESDGSLRDAYIEYNVGAFGLNYNLTDGEYLQLYCLVANNSKINALIDTIDRNQDALNENNLSYDYLLKPLVNKGNYAYYSTIPINTTVQYS